jgi:hypothetical protein
MCLCHIPELEKIVLQSLGLDSTKFDVHSLRSGGATTAAASGVNDKIKKKYMEVEIRMFCSRKSRMQTLGYQTSGYKAFLYMLKLHS